MRGPCARRLARGLGMAVPRHPVVALVEAIGHEFAEDARLSAVPELKLRGLGGGTGMQAKVAPEY